MEVLQKDASKIHSDLEAVLVAASEDFDDTRSNTVLNVLFLEFVALSDVLEQSRKVLARVPLQVPHRLSDLAFRLARVCVVLNLQIVCLLERFVDLVLFRVFEEIWTSSFRPHRLAHQVIVVYCGLQQSVVVRVHRLGVHLLKLV